MKYLFYYLSEDAANSKEHNEVRYLRSIGRVIVVTRGTDKQISLNNGIKNLVLAKQTNRVVSAYSIWRKICYLISRPSNSLTDKFFPSRNIYTGSVILRFITNCLWPLKYLGFIKILLPSYEYIYFTPFRWMRIFVRDKKRSETLFKRIIIHDALIIRLTRFTPFILMSRRSGWKTLANVKSWDNPFYTQFVLGANGYLTWSESMWGDVKKMQNIRSKAHHAWGPRPFYDFAYGSHSKKKSPNTVFSTKTIGYAAAFCDKMMAENEVMVIVKIAESLERNKIDAKILFRPYPIVSMSIYRPLLDLSNVEIVEIEGDGIDRFGDGREVIRFGSVEERINYLSRCNCFLSIATSFTFEAALYGLPILQYFIPNHRRTEIYEDIFFERLDISDHILKYLLQSLTVAETIEDIQKYIVSLQLGLNCDEKTIGLLDMMGFPLTIEQWNSGQDEFVSNLLMN